MDYVALIREELIIMARTPLELGTPDEHRSSILKLSFTYSNPELELQKRFSLTGGEVIRTADLIASASTKPASPGPTGLEPSMFFPLQRVSREQTRASSLDKSCICFMLSVEYLADPRHAPTAWTKFALFDTHIVDLENWSYPGLPFNKRKPVPDWVGYLKRILSEMLPRKIEDILLGELVESEGREVTMRACNYIFE
ncbi:hypothetical protein P7C70_g7014, partial [Phenoliferia sp. Uapishka_3]